MISLSDTLLIITIIAEFVEYIVIGPDLFTSDLLSLAFDVVGVESEDVIHLRFEVFWYMVKI